VFLKVISRFNPTMLY